MGENRAGYKQNKHTEYMYIFIYLKKHKETHEILKETIELFKLAFHKSLHPL